MSNFIAIEHQIGIQGPVSATSTLQVWPLGLEVRAQDWASAKTSANIGGGKFVYCQGSNVTAIGQFVHISNSSAVLLASANSVSFFPIGVAAGNLSATNVFGWVQIGGLCDYARGTNSSIGAGVPLYLAGTAGLLISNAAAGSRVLGVVAPVSYTSSQSASLTVQLYNPQMLGVTAGL